MEIKNIDHKKLLVIIGNLLGCALIILALSWSYKVLKSPISQAEESAAITITGDGEVTAIPDVANISFSLREVSKNVAEAQKNVNDKLTKSLVEIKALGVTDKDIKTTLYNVYPKYTYTNQAYCLSNCPPTKQVLEGYEVAQTISLKLKNEEGEDLTSQVLDILGKNNITEINGPSFSIDDEEKLKAQAREIAIRNAKAKAKVVAKSLGVEFENIIDYQEGANGYTPMYEAKGFGGAMMNTASVEVPKGENTVRVNVSITYSVR